MRLKILVIVIVIILGTCTSCSIQNSISQTAWHHIEILNSESQARGLQEVGFFTVKSSRSYFASRTYEEAYHSAVQNLQKEAAKRGARYILITYKSSMDWNFLQVTIEGYAYK